MSGNSTVSDGTTPTPLLPETRADCSDYRLVSPGDNCALIEAMFAISAESFESGTRLSARTARTCGLATTSARAWTRQTEHTLWLGCHMYITFKFGLSKSSINSNIMIIRLNPVPVSFRQPKYNLIRQWLWRSWKGDGALS